MEVGTMIRFGAQHARIYDHGRVARCFLSGILSLQGGSNCAAATIVRSNRAFQPRYRDKYLIAGILASGHAHR
jgi:hypothetical protein